MKRHAGFTLIELLVTISILTILLVLVVINLRSSQATARDEERKSDIAEIQQQLESYYRTAGTYPYTGLMDTEAHITTNLRDISVKQALYAPGSSTLSLSNTANASTTQSPTISQYFYQPIDTSGNLCTSSSADCRKYTLYYALETVSGTQSVRSINQ